MVTHAIIAGGLAASAIAAPSTIRVDAGPDASGVITAFTRASDDIGSVYAYGGFEFRGDLRPILEAEAINVFFVDTAEGLGFFAVADDGAGPGLSGNTWTGSLMFGSDAVLRIEDDGNEGVTGAQADAQIDAGELVSLSFTYNTSYTDGLAVRMSGAAGSWVDLLGFATDGPGRATRIVFHSADGGGTMMSIDGSSGARLTVIPLPGAGLLAAAGLLPLMIRRVR